MNNSSSIQQKQSSLHCAATDGQIGLAQYFFLKKRIRTCMYYVLEARNPVVNSGTETRTSYSFQCNLNDLLLRGSIREGWVMLPDGQSPSQPQVPGCGCVNRDPGANESMGLEQEHWLWSLASGGGDSDGGDWDGSGSSSSSSSGILSSSLRGPTITFGTRICLTSGKMMWFRLGVFNFSMMGCFLQKILTEENKSGVVTGVNSQSGGRWVN